MWGCPVQSILQSYTYICHPYLTILCCCRFRSLKWYYIISTIDCLLVTVERSTFNIDHLSLLFCSACLPLGLCLLTALYPLVLCWQPYWLHLLASTTILQKVLRFRCVWSTWIFSCLLLISGVLVCVIQYLLRLHALLSILQVVPMILYVLLFNYL